MRSQHKWWFLSEADEEQPGTDKDIDYYQHKSKQHEEAKPPLSGWVTCRSGVDPPPTLKAVGLMVPPGEEYNTLEHQLARWAIENGVIELVLGDSIHREIVARSTSLIRFLAGRCDMDDKLEDDGGAENKSLGGRGRNESGSPMHTDTAVPNKYCLKASHLLLAWKTCMNKADAAVSAEIYQLLVSILPSLSEELAIPLIREIHRSLDQPSEKGNHNLFEVSEFCCAIANMAQGDGNAGNMNSSNNNANGQYYPISMKVQVREEILSLQWSVLMHQDAWTLKSYESIKNYVSSEIGQLEPMASRLRDRFLGDCHSMMVKSFLPGETVVDESYALHMVQMFRFVLESYPRDEVDKRFLSQDKRLIEDLLADLTAYLERMNTISTAPPLRKVSALGVPSPISYNSFCFDNF